VPLPEYAWGILASVSHGDGSITDFRAGLEGVAGRPADVSRARRAGVYAVLASVPALLVALRLAAPLIMASMPGWYRDVVLNNESYVGAMRRADSAAAGGDSTARRTAEAVRLIFAAAMLEAHRGNQTNASLLAALPASLRSVLDSALQRYPAPDSQAVAAARAWLDVRVPVPKLRSGGLATVPKGVLQSLPILGILGVVGVVLALLLRGGALFRLFGIAVVRGDGAPAGRLRCAARSLVGWAPLLLVLALAAAPRGVSVSAGLSAHVTTTTVQQAPPSTDPRVPPWVRWVLFGLALGGAGVALWRPTRGVAERASGVVLVPR
jgi:hypothetical protein